MISRIDVLSRAANDCIKELYSYAQPHIEWDDFVKENEIYTKKYNFWERFRKLSSKENLTEAEIQEYSLIPADWHNKSITECIGPRPFEFYYLPAEILKDICNNYVYAYKIDSQQELLDTIHTLKEYCKKPIIDKYIEGELREDGTRWPGHRGYDHPDNLKKEINKILIETTTLVTGTSKEVSEEICNKFFEFLDMAGKFYNWNRDLNSFNMSVYLGPSPNSNKERVIEYWKKYRHQDIEIDEEQIKKEYYGEDDE